MEVAHLILALAGDLSEDGRLHLLNSGFDSLSGPFPGELPVPLYVAGKLLFTKEEEGKRYSTAVEIVAPDGKVVAKIEKEIEAGESADATRPAGYSGMVTFFSVPILTLGLYKVRQLVSGKAEKEIPLFIEAAADFVGENPHGYT